jgi:alpha-mannosidase
LAPEQASEITAGTSRLVVLMMSAHMDWDWLLPFPLLVAGDPEAGYGSGVRWYFAGDGNAPAASILAQAAQALANDPDYRYSVCEMGFLRGFAQVDPANFAKLAQNASHIDLSGAGITSPDNLLPHGEAFIRNYLVGRLWAAGALPGATISQSYLPDDFGHDPELPVTLHSMGVQGTAFARLPGIWNDNPDNQVPPDGATLQAMTLLGKRQIDFIWRGSDGSGVLAHWMPGWYGKAQPSDFVSPATLKAFLEKKLGPTPMQDILVSSPTNYVYVPMADDFQTPIPNVASIVRAWNQAPPVIDGMTTYCVAGTFDQFVRLAANASGLVTYGGPGNPPLYSTPYMAGAQASRPLLKRLHADGVRALLAAETFAVIAEKCGAALWSGPPAVQARQPHDVLLDAWNQLVPSTHHDFITGTAHPYVYRTEQLPLLHAAVANAEWLRDDAMSGVASMLQPPDLQNDSVAVFNQLGFARTTLVECDSALIGNAACVTCGGATSTVQRTTDGRSLFVAPLPAMGYAIATPAASASAQFSEDEVTVTADAAAPTQITLENAYVRVVLTAATGWAIASFFDKQAGREVIPTGAAANAIAVFKDGGSEYAFGCEKTGGIFADLGLSQTVQSVEQAENGLLRAVVRVITTSPSPATGDDPLVFVREYTLQSGEAFLRMALTGRAPLTNDGNGTVVFVKFPLGAPIDGIARGTPTHWTGQMPQLVWNGFTPYAAHHFAVASAGGKVLAGVLPRDSRSWGLMWNYANPAWRNDGVLYGALLRNTTGSYYGWTYAKPPFPGGTDREAHTSEYALLAPSACGDPASGAPLFQGLHFANPPAVAPLTPYTTADTPAPANYGLATVTSPALLTAAKQGSRDPDSLVFRVYQPTNKPLPTVKLSFDPATVPGWAPGKTILAQLMTAMEEPLGGLTVSGNAVSFGMSTALATVSLSVTP